MIAKILYYASEAQQMVVEHEIETDELGPKVAQIKVWFFDSLSHLCFSS